MAEPTQFTFDLQEVAAALIKQKNLHDGVWLALEFGLAAGIIGVTPADARPAALVQLLKVQLVKQTQLASALSHLTVHAAEVNPAPQ